MHFFKLTVFREIAKLHINKPILFMLFAWPFIYAILLGSVYSSRIVMKMPAAICDMDNTSMSRLILRYLNATRSLDVSIRTESVEELHKLLIDGKIEAGIYIPKNFTSDIKRNKSVDIITFANGGNMVVGNIVLSEVKTIAGTISAGARIKYLRKTGSSGKQAYAEFSPVNTISYKLFNPGGNYVNFLMPGIWSAILQQILLVISALILVTEKENNTVSCVYNLSGKNVFTLITGKVIPYMFFFFIVFGVFDLIIFPVFSIHIKSSLLGTASLNLLFIYAVLGMGMLISAFTEEAIDSMKGVLLIGAPAFLLSGYIWPISYMPLIIQPLSSIIPLTHYLKALRALTEYGASMTQIMPSLIILLMLGSLFYLLAYLKTKYDVKKYA